VGAFVPCLLLRLRRAAPASAMEVLGVRRCGLGAGRRAMLLLVQELVLGEATAVPPSLACAVAGRGVGLGQ
jgi:hypothetical protein